MKKLFVLSFASILLLTGCGATETLSCSYRNTANNGTTDITYDIDHEGDEVKKVRITYDYDFNNNNNNNNGTGNNNNGGNNTNTDNNNTDNTAGVVADTDNDGMEEAELTNNARVGDNTNNGNNGTTDGNNMTTNGTNGNTTNNNNGTGNNNGNNDITTYNNATDNARDDNNGNHTDGVGTGTDGTTNDTELDDDGIVDGIVGSAIDAIVGTVTDVILDSAGLRDRHANVQNTYGNVTGFSTQTTNDTNDNYKVTYVIDYDTISDNDLARFNLSRDLDDLRDSYVNQGFTCK